jgi:hypothetical protein
MKKSNFTETQIVKAIKEHNWLSYPLHYGSNYCADGDHTFVTIIYPDKHIESLYVRCWTQPDNRTKQ